MFIDRVKLELQAGKGGDGCQSLDKDIFNRKGIPDGGRGGDGGDIILIVDENKQTLLDFHYKYIFTGEDGKNGSSNHKKGKAGKPLYLHIPFGTLVLDASTGEILCDMTKPGQTYTAAVGGIAGHGNSHNRDATKGVEGEKIEIMLQLKLMADVGIIGLPNVGKSSLISKISNARPQVANYPFTTKSPVLGVIKWKDFTTTVIADIPGLIEGAHEGKGLGYDFLRHIERTRILVHIVDLDPFNQRDPVKDFETVNNEIECYNPELLKLPQIIVCNKLDLTGADKVFARFKKKIRKRACAISVATGLGIDDMLDKLFEKVVALRKKGRM